MPMPHPDLVQPPPIVFNNDCVEPVGPPGPNDPDPDPLCDDPAIPPGPGDPAAPVIPASIPPVPPTPGGGIRRRL